MTRLSTERQGRGSSSWTVTFRMPGDPIGPANIDGPNAMVVEAESPEEATRKIRVEVEGAEVITVRPWTPPSPPCAT